MDEQTNPKRVPYHCMPRRNEKYSLSDPISREKDNGSIITVSSILDAEVEGLFVRIEKPIGDLVSVLSFAVTMDGAAIIHELLGEKLR